MKRYFVETNGYNCVAFVDNNGKAYVFHEETFDEELTFEYAKSVDYSNVDGCETAEEIAACTGGDLVVDAEDVFKIADNIIEF